jgi:hypothetical protein
MVPDGPGISNWDSELVRTFHVRVLPALVYVEVVCLKTGQRSAGTGTVVGYQGNRTDGWLPLVVTAGHIVKSEAKAESLFRLCRYSFADPLKLTVRVAEFETGQDGPREPCGLHYSGPHADILDIGFLRGPLNCLDGKSFFDLDNHGDPLGGTMSVEDDAYYSAGGSQVAWAGFPSLAELARRPQPCYFQGSVSALILHDEFVTYLLDGHNTFGVSGGPVWAQKSASEAARLIGVISSYRSVPTHPQMPGFVHAVPVQVVVDFLKRNWGLTFKR